MKTKPVWELSGMDYSTYTKLPWPEKKKLIRKAFGIPISDSCYECGTTERRMRQQAALAALPPMLRDHPQGLLLQAYFEHQAMEHNIRYAYPNATD